MKLFTKEIDKKLFAQYPKGNNLEEQMAVAKIFNPYGNGRWYLLNSDPTDPDYLWAIVQMGKNVEIGSVSRKELENIRISAFRFPLERDLGFRPVNAYELWKGLRDGKFYKDGGFMEQSENKEMLLNQAEEIEHHVEEFEEAAKKSDHVPAWVVAKAERASTDLSDASHYLEAENEQKREEMEGEEEYAHGGEVKWQEAEYGDSALVVSENKMGIIMKPYGRKFHLKFVDGTEKTYDANDLKFFKDIDEFDLGGFTDFTKDKVSLVYVKLNGEGVRIIPMSEKVFNELKKNKNLTLEKLEEANVRPRSLDEIYGIIDEFSRQKYAKGGMMEDGGVTSSPNTEFMKWFDNWSNSVNKYVHVSISIPNEFSSPIKDGKDKIVMLDLIEKKGDCDAKKYMNEILKKADELGVSIYLQPIPRTNNLKSEEHKNKITKDYLIKYYQKFGFENTDGGFMVRAPKMAEGGKMENGGVTEKKYFMTFYFEQKQPSGGYGINRKSITVRAKNETEAKSKAKKLVKESFRSGLPIKNMRVLEDTIKVEEIKYAEGGNMREGEETDKKITFKRGDYFVVLKDMGKLKRFRIWKIEGNYVTINYSKYDGTDVYDSNETKSNLKYLLENGYIKKVNKKEYWNRKYENYAEGGKIKFKDKVASIKASLLKRKKVPKVVQKDYGKTFSPAEAEDSAKRIVGAQTARERLMMRIKSKKKK